MSTASQESSSVPVERDDADVLEVVRTEQLSGASVGHFASEHRIV